MFKIVLLTLALTGLQARPISRHLAKSHQELPLGVQDVPLPEGFRQGTEPSRRTIVDLNTGLVKDYISEMERRTGFLSPPLGNGHGEMERRHWLIDNTAEEVPVQKNGGGWVRVEGRATLPDGFRQGTEPSLHIAEGFRQGTEPSMPFRDGYRQGTERFMPIPDGFRQGTEPSLRLPAGFRQGTEPTNPLNTKQVNTIPDGFRQGTEPSYRIPDGFRQGTERFMPLPDGFRQGTEPSLRLPAGFRQGTEPTNPNDHREVALSLNAKVVNTIPDGFRQGTEPSYHIPNGFRQGTEPSHHIPDGFRQGTERFMPLPDGFRQGTEPSLRLPAGFRQGTEPTNPNDHREVALSLNAKVVNTIPDGFRQGTEPSYHIPDGFRQGTEPSHHIPDGFRQGTERFMPIPDGFRQGTEPSLRIPNGFRQGTEPTNPKQHKEVALSLNAKQVNSFPDGFRQGTEPTNPLSHKDAALSFKALPAETSNHLLEGFRPGAGPFMPVRDGDRQPLNHIEEPNTARCDGEIINGRCYVFNPMPMPFLEAQDSCKSHNPSAELASVTNEDLQSRLVSMVTNGGQRDPVMTWLGGTVKNQRASWLDGSEWKYSDWMPGQPNIHTDKPVCVEMFRLEATWWTAADCDLKRASICSYPVVA